MRKEEANRFVSGLIHGVVFGIIIVLALCGFVLRFEWGYCPDSYSCKGYRDGWFAIEIEGVTGYVSEEYVWWDAIDTN